MNVASPFESFGRLSVQTRVRHRAALVLSFAAHSLLLAIIYLLIFLLHREPTATVDLEQDRQGEIVLVTAERARMESLLPQGDPVQISLFGVGDTPGRTFVFLLDRSKSMGENGLNVLEAAKAELMTGVQKLQSNHRFQIIVYDDKTVFVGPQRRLLKPSEETMRLVRESLAGVYAARGTSHANALSVAIGLRPDVIFLLTDAGLPIPAAGEIAQILDFAKGKTTVHCIQFSIESEGKLAEFLIELSKQTGGQARFVNVSGNRQIANQSK